MGLPDALTRRLKIAEDQLHALMSGRHQRRVPSSDRKNIELASAKCWSESKPNSQLMWTGRVRSLVNQRPFPLAAAAWSGGQLCHFRLHLPTQFSQLIDERRELRRVVRLISDQAIDTLC